MGKKYSITKVIMDGWENLLTGIGIMNRDKTRHTVYGSVLTIDQVTATDLYRGDGFGKKIVDLPAREMFREWIEVEGDTEGLTLKELDRIKVKQQLRLEATWALVYGGAIATMLIDDGGEFEDPVNEENIKKVESIQVYNRWQVYWTTADQYQDPKDPKFGKPEFYTVRPYTLPFFKVHESRVLLMDGKPVPDRVRRQNNGWGDSVYQSAFERLKAIGSSYVGAENIVDEFVTALLTIENLQDLIASGQEELILKRLNLIDQSRHIINSTILDKDEKYERHSAQVRGLSDLLDRFTEALAAVTEIPVSLLMGRSQKGLAAGGAQATDLRNWYDKISGDQEDMVKEPLSKLIWYIMKSKDSLFKGTPLDPWSIIFKPLWQPTEEEIVETRNKQSEMDERYISSGVLNPEEVAISRFGGDTYSIETQLAEGRREEEIPAEGD